MMVDKMVGDYFFGKKRTDDPSSLKHGKNHSISQRVQHKCIFVIYAEIQDGCQMVGEQFYAKMDR